MAEQPKSDHTTITISRELHRELKIAAARLAVTQRSLLERIVWEWLREVSWLTETGEFKEE